MAFLRAKVRWQVLAEVEGNVDRDARARLDALRADPDGVLSGPRSLARESAGRKRFYHLPGDDGASGLFVKVFTRPPGAARWRTWLRPSKARREAEVARALCARGLDAVAPLAVGEERRAGFLLRSFSVIPERPARDLRARLSDPALDAAARRALLIGFGRYARALHEAGVDQDDFSPNNFLVDDEGHFALIDFERCALRNSALPRPRRHEMLAKLHRQDLGLSRSDRLRFLGAYLDPEHRLDPSRARAARRRAWSRIEPEFLRIRARDARRAADAAFREGRHLRRDGDAWQVRGREDVPVLVLAPGPEAARRTWIRAHQLERLGLPALRPVRLDGAEVWLATPTGAGLPSPAAIERARRELTRLGAVRDEARWLGAPEGAVLENPDDWQPHSA